MTWLEQISAYYSLGNDGLGMLAGIEARNPALFSGAMMGLVKDLAHNAKIKELDDPFLDNIQVDITSLTTKIFAKLC